MQFLRFFPLEVSFSARRRFDLFRMPESSLCPPWAMGKGACWPPWRLLGAAVSLVLLGACDGFFVHSQKSFSTAVSEPIEGLPQFTTVRYINDQLFVQYDSNTRKKVPKVSWIKEAEKEDPEYWDRETQISQSKEQTFRENVHIAMNRFNQTGGLHTWQGMYGCEQREDGSTGGYWQFGYDGRDFLAFDKETLTWTAANGQAEMSKRKWDADRTRNQYLKSYLEEDCIEWLNKYFHYGEERLKRKERPAMKVTSRAGHDNMETLICRADGFYPKDIHAVWTRDGEVWEQETLRGLVVPNSDGTYHTWISTKVNPKDKGRFQCRVDHASWKDPVDFAVEEPAFNLRPFIVCTALGVILLVAVSTGIWLFRKKQKDGYKAASGSDGTSSSPSHRDLEEIILEGEGGEKQQDGYKAASGNDGTSSSSGHGNNGISSSSGHGSSVSLA